jgi:hypothetical protein
VEACLEAGALPLGLRIYTIMTEDHFPPVYAYHRNGFRTAAPTVDISLAAGECELVTNTLLTIPQISQANLKIIAWAQKPSATGPANVYQAGISAYPFVPPIDTCPWDCGGNDNDEVDVIDFFTLIAEWGMVGAGCDFQNDGVDVVDFFELLGKWGPCP